MTSSPAAIGSLAKTPRPWIVERRTAMRRRCTRGGYPLRGSSFVDQRLTSATYGRHGSLRRLGQAGCAVGTVTPGTTGRTRYDEDVPKAIDTVPFPFGSVSGNDQIGCVPFGAAIVTRMRVPLR